MFSERLENAVGKGEIARYEQFLLFPQCFPETCTADTYNQELFENGLKEYRPLLKGGGDMVIVDVRPAVILCVHLSSLFLALPGWLSGHPRNPGLSITCITPGKID